MEYCQLLFLLLSTLTVSWGQQVYLSLGNDQSLFITTNNTEIHITDIGEDTPGGRPSLTCNTDLTTCCTSGDGLSAGDWYHPDGTLVPRPADAAFSDPFYRTRNVQVARLNRRQGANPLSPTGSYCCVIPTTGGNMIFCANLVVCLSLTLTNGMISYSDPTLGVGSVATHICDSGYALSGGSTRTCQSNGTWSGSALACEITVNTCPDLTMPANGAVMYNDGSIGSRQEGTVATHTCNTGFALSGTSTRTCELGNTWSGAAPTCEVVCSDLTMPANGGISYNLGSTNNRPVGTDATYSCTSGFSLSGGTNMRTCQSDRSWTGSAPTCQMTIGPTVPPACTDLPVPDNGQIDYNQGSTNNRPVSTVATYSCDNGYIGSSTRTCQSSATWDGSPASCTPVDCGTPPTVNNAEKMPTGTTFGQTATYTCNTGYQLSGPATVTCQASGSWETAPMCNAISCGFPPSIDNGSPGTPTSTTFGGTASYSCDNGFIHDGPSAITCQADGSWSTGICVATPPVYLSLQTTNYVTANGQILISSIGESNSDALVCHTDLTTCCTGADQGEWLFPEGSAVPSSCIFSSRDTSVVRLHQRGTADVTGSYCCRITTSQGEMEFCVELVEQLGLSTTTTMRPGTSSVVSCDATGAVVGGVVALIAIIAVAIAAVLITHLVLRQQRTGKMPVTNELQLDGRGQSSNPTYEVVDATYEEIPPASGSTKVKGDYEYTQNEAYTTTPSGRESGNVTTAEGIYDN